MTTQCNRFVINIVQNNTLLLTLDMPRIKFQAKNKRIESSIVLTSLRKEQTSPSKWVGEEDLLQKVGA